MDTESERMTDYDKTSPWPIVLVFGLVSSEIGILFGLYPVAVGGLAVFVGSVSGIVNEAGYVTSPWRLLSGLGAALVVIGALIVSTQANPLAVEAVLAAAEASSVALRGVAIAGTGAILAAVGLLAPGIANQ